MDYEIKKTISNNLKEARERTGLTRTAYAEGIGSNRTTMYLYESGRRLIPTDILYRIWKTYGTTPNEILGVKD